ncbi:E3 ubiquitin-protein ligase HERC2, partial [Stegodyphus mimosarum]
MVEVSDDDSSTSFEAYSDSDSFTADDETDVPKEDNTYRSRNDFHSIYEYSVYMSENMNIGSWVRCCTQYEELQVGDIGVVVHLEYDGYLNVFVDWKRIG